MYRGDPADSGSDQGRTQKPSKPLTESVKGRIIWGRYQLKTQEAESPKAERWKALDLYTGEWAIVVLLCSTRPALMGRFSRLQDVHSKLRHPHLIRIKDAGVVDGSLPYPYVVMDQVPGLEFLRYAQIIREASRPAVYLRWVVRMMAPIFRALGMLHSAGITLGDIRPEDVIVTRDVRAVLANLGLERAFSADDENAPNAVREDIRQLGEVVQEAIEEVRGDVLLDEILKAVIAPDPSRGFKSAVEVSRRLKCWLDANPGDPS